MGICEVSFGELSMIKAVIRFFKKPKVYRVLLFVAALAYIYFEVVAPLAGWWSPRHPNR